MDWQPGYIIDNRYRIESQLGIGGFGITYKARQPNLKLPYVLKTPRADLKFDRNYDRFVERFKQEAENLARFALEEPHPHIVRIFELLEVPIEAGSRERIPCLVMDFIRGESLYHRVARQGALSEADAVQYVLQIGAALSAVHEADLVHWDATPLNIMLKPNGTAVLIDFGIAGDCPPSSFSRDFGNRAFAPYEQMLGERSPAVDLYTLAASLYYAVTGKLPMSAMEQKLRNRSITPPQKYCPQLGDGLNAAILAAMALEPQNRPESVAAWLAQLVGEKAQPQVDIEIDEKRYGKLRDLLAAGEWSEADAETARVMRTVANQEEEGWLDVEDINKFPCKDLKAIDLLWVKYSNGRFGFSVQNRIYQELGGTRKYEEEVWEAFGDRVGWRKGGDWLSYRNLTFSTKALLGHLPRVNLTFVAQKHYLLLCSSLASRLIKCNI
ncbi:MAG: serine/threonine-protein kinase [Cyanobacteriota bacterium]|nr:serine/threonine-protein kinase [Cyanobacteriota bacterium]